MVYRPAETLAHFSGNPAYNFDGGRQLWKNIRKLCDDGKAGKIHHLTIHTGMTKFEWFRNVKKKHGKWASPPEFYTDAVQQHIVERQVRLFEAKDIVKLAQLLPYRCPRCWSKQRPRFVKNFLKGKDIKYLQSESQLEYFLCNDCSHKANLRRFNEVAALNELTQDFSTDVRRKANVK
jgi:hypothetical protein